MRGKHFKSLASPVLNNTSSGRSVDKRERDNMNEALGITQLCFSATCLSVFKVRAL